MDKVTTLKRNCCCGALKMHDLKLQDLKIVNQIAFGRYMTKAVVPC